MVSIIKTYFCDICGFETSHKEIYGIVPFANQDVLTPFSLDSPYKTDNKHICKKCAKIIASEFSNPMEW